MTTHNLLFTDREPDQLARAWVLSGCNYRSRRVSCLPSSETTHAHVLGGREPVSQIDMLPPDQCATTGPTASLFKRRNVVVRHVPRVLHAGQGGNMGNR
jgi:hypothetical protein